MSVTINGSAGVTVNSGAVLGITSGTAVASTSGTSIDFTSIPSWVKRITVMFNGVSLSGTDDLLVQLGVSGSYSATYASTSAAIVSASAGISTSTTGFIVRLASAAAVLSGTMTISNISSNTWVSASSGKGATTFALTGGGDVSLAGALTSVRITTTGANTFDAGSINIIYE